MPLEQAKNRNQGRRKMKVKACENHDHETIVVFNGDFCPFCKMAKDLKTIAEEVEKSMAILKQVQMKAGEGGLK